MADKAGAEATSSLSSVYPPWRLSPAAELLLAGSSTAEELQRAGRPKGKVLGNNWGGEGKGGRGCCAGERMQIEGQEGAGNTEKCSAEDVRVGIYIITDLNKGCGGKVKKT